MFMRFKRLAAAVMAATMCGSLLVGCGGSDNKSADNNENITDTIKVWGPAEDQAEENGKWLQTMCEQFNSEHPEWNLTFEYGVCSETDAGKTVTQDPANSGDVYFFANDQLQTLIDANAIAKLGGETADYVKSTNSSATKALVACVPLSPLISTPAELSLPSFPKYVQPLARQNDDIYQPSVILNATLFFESIVSRLFISLSENLLLSQNINHVLVVNGTQATKALVALVNNPNFVNDLQGVGIAGLRDGSVGAYFSGSWDYKSVKEILGDNFGAVSLPTVKINGTDKQLKAFAGSKAIAVNPNCKYQQVAVALAKYLGGKDAQAKHYELRNVIPCNTELLAKDVIKKDALVSAQNDTFNKTSVIKPTVTGMNAYWTPAQNCQN